MMCLLLIVRNLMISVRTPRPLASIKQEITS